MPSEFLFVTSLPSNNRHLLNAWQISRSNQSFPFHFSNGKYTPADLKHAKWVRKEGKTGREGEPYVASFLAKYPRSSLLNSVYKVSLWKIYILLGNTGRSFIKRNSILTIISVKLDQDENFKKQVFFHNIFQTSLRAVSREYYILCPDLCAQKSIFVELSVLY